jgi:2-polyprenyl-3-methyl-5-hydroxy-6-metoxy-1,4-benzoquinol methylase
VANSYSPTWFELFLETQPYTAEEVAFVARNLPDPSHHRILDVCCGPGRHARPLAEQGYEVDGNRLTAQVDYDDGSESDTFEWQLFMPEEICRLAAEFDLQLLLMCTEWDEQKPVSPEKPRMNLIFERRTGD